MKKRTQLILLILLWLLPGWLPAQTNAPDRVASTRRFLFVLETSRAMQRRSESVLSTVQGLLQSSFQGQARDGDTLGFWTFNAEIYTGRLPLQRWSTAEQRNIFNRTSEFVRGQKYEKQGNLDLVLAAANHLIESSDLITIVLVATGEAEIHGTEFDDSINSTYRLWRNQQQQARSPFVTVLRGVKGKLTQAVTTPALWPVELPPLPPEPAPIAAAPTRKPKASAPPPMALPLILSGRKSASSEPAKPTEPVPATTTAPATASTSPASQPAPVTPAAASPTTPAVSPVASRPPPESAPARPVSIEPAPVATTAPPPGTPQPTSTTKSSAAAAARGAPSSPTAASPPVEKPAGAAPPPAPAAPLATAAPPAPTGKSWLGWLALCFVVAAIAIVALWRAQRSRRSHVSLITQSLDRERTK